MRFSGVSALAIWNNAVRTLSSFGVGAFDVRADVNQSLAANSTFVVSPPAGQNLNVTIAAVADASGSVVIQFSDGTNTWTMVTIAAGSTGGQDNVNSTNTVFTQIHNNSATVAAHFFTTGYYLKK